MSARAAVALAAAVVVTLLVGIVGRTVVADDERIVVNPDAAYPEGPLVVANGVYYAEMGRDRVMYWDGDANREVWSRPGCSPTSVARFGDDLAVLCHREDSVMIVSTAGETLAVVDRDRDGLPFVNPNASTNDEEGGIYFSSSGPFAPGAPALGAVMYLDRAGTLSRLAEGIHYANGVALTPDGRTLYVSEHLSRQVLAFGVAEDGSLYGKRVFVALDDLEGEDPDRGWEVGPDGLAVDSGGNLYVAEYGAGHVLVISGEGELEATIDVPERYVTAPALMADEDRIFITAPVSLSNPTASGAVYSVVNPLARQN